MSDSFLTRKGMVETKGRGEGIYIGGVSVEEPAGYQYETITNYDRQWFADFFGTEIVGNYYVPLNKNGNLVTGFDNNSIVFGWYKDGIYTPGEYWGTSTESVVLAKTEDSLMINIRGGGAGIVTFAKDTTGIWSMLIIYSQNLRLLSENQMDSSYSDRAITKKTGNCMLSKYGDFFRNTEFKNCYYVLNSGEGSNKNRWKQFGEDKFILSYYDASGSGAKLAVKIT